MATRLMPSRPVARPTGAAAALSALARVASGLVERLLFWAERRRQRRRLSELPDHLLRDIGADRARVLIEAGKPFWRD